MDISDLKTAVESDINRMLDNYEQLHGFSLPGRKEMVQVLGFYHCKVSEIQQHKIRKLEANLEKYKKEYERLRILLKDYLESVKKYQEVQQKIYVETKDL